MIKNSASNNIKLYSALDSFYCCVCVNDECPNVNETQIFCTY